MPDMLQTLGRKQHQARNFITRVLILLFEPSPAIIDPEQRRRAQFLSPFLLLFSFAIYLYAILLSTRTIDGYEAVSEQAALLAFICATIYLFLYFLSRTRRYQLACFLFSLNLSGGIFAVIFLAPTPLVFNAALPWLGLGLFLCGLVATGINLSILYTINLILTVSAHIALIENPIPEILSHALYQTLVFSLIRISVKTNRIALTQLEQEKIQAQKARAESERFRTLLDSSNEAIFLVDPSTSRFIDVNRTAEERLGYSREELLSMRVADVEVADFVNGPEKWMVLLKEIQLKDGRYHRRGVHRRKDGSTFPVEASVVLRELNQKTYILALITDITERVRAEEMIADQRVRLASSARMSAIGEMAAGMAHEINNPLAIISGKAQQLQMLLKSGKAISHEDLERATQVIDSTAMRIARIIKGLRAIARDSERDPFEVRSLKNILQETLDFCQARFRNHEVQLSIQEIPDNIFFLCQPTQIMQVLLNLLNNAFDAVSEVDDKWIQLSIEKKENNRLAIKISDSGKGVPPELRDRIMLPFFTSKKTGHGTGLGLSISKRIIEEHNGELYLDTLENPTTFVVVLPLADKSTELHASY